MPDFPDLDFGEVSLPTASPVDTATHEVDIDGEMPQPHEPLATEEEATKYFNSVDESEALNWLMFLHDTRAISFDRLNQLKELLNTTPSFLPKEF